MADGLIWAVYYLDQETRDFKVVTNREAEIFDLPGSNVLAIAQVDRTERVGYEFMTGAHAYGKDFFWYDFTDGCWQLGDVFGLAQYFAEPGPNKVLLGQAVSRERWLDLSNRMIEDWGEKYSFFHGERRPGQ